MAAPPAPARSVDLGALAERVRPGGGLTGERRIAVHPALGPLLPGEGLRRGSIVRTGGVAATSLALAMLARATVEGAWAGIVGLPSIGLAAAAELGVALERVFLVAPPPAGHWADIVATVADGAELVLAAPPPTLRATDARRLQARIQSKGAVLLLAGGSAEQGAGALAAELAVVATRAGWEGLGAGHGRLLARRVEVEVSGRRSGGSVRRHALLLPAAGGGIAPAPARRSGEDPRDQVAIARPGSPGGPGSPAAWRDAG